MICKPCGIAGDMIAEARPSDPLLPIWIYGNPDPVALKDIIRPVAAFFHGKCRGSTHCDCAHIIDLKGKTIEKA